jgi:hypothetical protein
MLHVHYLTFTKICVTEILVLGFGMVLCSGGWTV